MEIRKGPYGQFVTLRCEERDVVSGYAAEMIRKDIAGFTLPVYINDTSFGRELAFDCTGMKRLSEITTITKNKMILRNSIADLFISISKMSDVLLAPGNIVWDNTWLFWDEDNKRLRLCVHPFESDPEALRLSSLGDDKTQDFISHSCFKEVLTSGERDSLLFAIRDNDCSLLERSAVNIKNTSPDVRPSAVHTFHKEIAIALLSAIIALASVILSELFISFLFFAASCTLLISTVLKDGRSKKSTYDISDNSKTRILFDEEHSDPDTVSCMILTYYSGAEQIRKAIYTQRATVGSDCFLSDITVDNDSVSPLHVQITKNKDIYTVTDISKDNMTFLDGLRLEKGREYEVRDGQRMMLGDVSFDIRLGLR